MKKERGFSLIEVIAAVLIMMVSMAAVTSLGAGTMKWNTQGHRVTAATNLARDKIEELRRVPYYSVTSGANAAPLDAAGQTGGSNAIYSRSWTVSSGPTPTTRKLVVTVAWGSSPLERVTLQTLLGS